ncbi:MAG TPA: protein kinase [Kofleriaceae bacterium]|nr:protein kinase [Kofleriaceae bacterium]
MGTSESRPFASSSDGVRALCTRCGKTWPAETMSCSSCGAELGGETVLDDVHRVDTLPLDARVPNATSSQSDTTPEAEAFGEETPIKSKAFHASELPLFAERSDAEIKQVTALVPRKPIVPATALPTGSSSSDPPTRLLRGFEQHIELPNGSVVDDYEIDVKLGAGAMGVVYGAKHVKLGRRVAIKVIAPTMGEDPQALGRFEREARALASLHHPNIVDVSSFGTLSDGRSYFVMEYLVGETLEDRLVRGRIPLDEALDTLDQMARALEGAHTQGIVHRDLKPSNTFLVRIPREQRSIVKLLDFGLAKLAVADGVEKTASGAVIGTALYISPEQARSPNVDGRTDVYALGCIAYELVLNRHPFPEARTPTAAIAAHLTEPVPQPRTIWPGIPAALDLLLFSMLAKDPSYRPTLAQVRNVIASVRSPTTAAGREMRMSTEPTRRVDLRSRVWMAALIAFTLLVGIMIGAVALGRKSSNGNAPREAPAGLGAASRNSENRATPPTPLEPAPVAPSPVAPSPVAPSPTAPSSVIETSVAPIPAPVADTPKVTKPAGRSIPHSPRQTAASSAASDGALALDSKPKMDVLVDGEPKGQTPVFGLKLPVGRHKITLINDTYSIKESFRVDIKPARVERIVKDYSDRIPEVKKPDARTTINPFEKQGSAAR